MIKKTSNILLLLSVIMMLLVTVLPVPVVAQSWLDNDWGYRQQLTITGSSTSSQTDYTIELLVYKGAGTSSGSTVYCQTHANDNFSDLRFTTEDGITELSYWIETSSLVSGTSVNVHVEFPTIPQSTTVNYYIYYGNASATTTSSGDDTFQLFDDFTGGTRLVNVSLSNDISEDLLVVGNYAYVAINGNPYGYIYKIDIATMTSLGYVQLPYGVETLDSDDTYLYVAYWDWSGNGRVGRIALSTFTLGTTLSLSGAGTACNILVHGTDMFVSRANGIVNKVDLTTWTVTGTVDSALGLMEMMAVDDGDTYLYVSEVQNEAGGAHGAVLRITLADFTTTSTLNLSLNDAEGLAYYSGHIYTIHQLAPAKILKIDEGTFTEEGSLTLSVNSCKSGVRLVDDQLYLLSATNPGYVDQVDLTSFAEVTYFSIGDGMAEESIDIVGDKIYVTSDVVAEVVARVREISNPLTVKWTVSATGSVSKSGGVLTVTNTGGGWASLISRTQYGTTAMEARAMLMADATGESSYLGYQESDGSARGLFYAGDNGAAAYVERTISKDAGGQETTDITVAETAYHNYKVLHKQSTHQKFYYDDSLLDTDTTRTPDATLPIYVGVYDEAATNPRVVVDWIYVRKYVDAEPTITSWDAEEENPATTAPTITTGSAINITTTTATLQGTLDDLGDYTPVYTYFEYGTTTSYGSSTPEVQHTAVGSLSAAITGLLSNTSYNFRVVVRYNGAILIYGTNATFTTSSAVAPNPPTNFVVSSTTATTVTLTWTKGSTGNTVIRSSTLAYPTAPTEGTAVYSSTGTTVTVDPLTTGTRYYFSAWGESSSVYSTTYATVSVIVSGGSTDELQIESVAVFSDYKSGGDLMVMVEVLNTLLPFYTNGSLPERYFTLQFLDTDASTVLAATPLRGYGDKPFGIYISSSLADQLTYGDTYNVRVIGTYATPQYDIYELQPQDWQGSNDTLIDAWIRQTAYSMEAFYDETFLTYEPNMGEILNTKGGTFFINGIDQIGDVRPLMFSDSVKSVTFKDRASSNAIDQGDWEDEVGSTIAADATSFGALVGVDGKVAIATAMALGIVVIVIACASSRLDSMVGVGLSGGIVYIGSMFHVIEFMWIGVPLAILMFMLARKVFLKG